MNRTEDILGVPDTMTEERLYEMEEDVLRKADGDDYVQGLLKRVYRQHLREIRTREAAA